MTDLDKALLRTYIKDCSLFGRTVQIRQSKERQALCKELGLSHEQLEGWALMLQRNVLHLPHRLDLICFSQEKRP